MKAEKVKTDFVIITEDIGKINHILSDYKEETKYMPKLADEINLFKTDCQKFENLKRFTIPIIGKINCGKSTILNFLLNLDDILQTSCDITTKFISIIRHNKSLKGKSPLIYNVKFEKRGYVNNTYLYNFEKNGDCLKGNPRDLIKERNEQLMKDELDKLPENYFYIIESYIHLFEGEYEKYSDNFEFMDVPGLNEASFIENQANIYFEKLVPLFINNVKFGIFIFDAVNYEKQTNSTIKIKDICSVFYEKMNDFNEDKKQNEMMDSIFVLNKIDLSDKDGGIPKEKEDFEKYLKFKLNIPFKDNNIILFRADKEYLYKNRFKNFDNYINYIILRNGKNDNEKYFKRKLKTNLEKEFNITILYKDEEKDDDSDDDSDEEEENKDELSKKIKSINNSLNAQLYSDSLTKKNYIFYENYYNTNISKAKQKSIKDDLTKYIEKSIYNTHKNFISNLNNNKKLYDNLLLQLKIKKEDILDIDNIDKSKIITFEHFFEQKNYYDILNNLYSILATIKEVEPKHEYIKKIYKNFLENKNYILNYHKYKVAVFGEYSSGKSSLLNSLIGIDILPESNGHCTKVILIIQYTKLKKDISLFSAKLNEDKTGNFVFYFIQDELIAKGEDLVRENLKNINNMHEGGIQYYILNTPIKFLDDLIEEQNLKEKIQFIDTPGLDSLLKEYTDTAFPKLIEYIDLFIYTNNNNIILQKESESAVRKMIEFILEKKGYFNFDSFIFIINSFNKLDLKDKSLNEQKLAKFKKDIFKIIKQYKESDWNNYINKYSKIIDKKEDISCFYFSKEIFRDEQNRIAEFLDFKNLFGKLNNEFSNMEINDKITKINTFIKKHYINKLSNKKEFSENGIQIDDANRTELKNILKIDNNDLEANKKDLDNIIIKYDFVKKNIMNFYTFKDFLSKLKEKISNETNIHFLLILYKLSLDLYKSFKLIENNIKRWESNDKKEIAFKDEFLTIYEFYKNRIREEFEKRKQELRDNFNKLIEGENKIDEINTILKDLLKEVENQFDSYLKRMKKEARRIEQEISLDLRDENIFFVDYNSLLKKTVIFGGAYGIFNIITFGTIGYFGLSAEGALITLTSTLSGGIFGLVIGIVISLIVVFGSRFFSKFVSKCNNKGIIDVFSEQILNKIEAIEYRINEQMDLYFYSAKEQINDIILSQKKPMKNLIENKDNKQIFILLKEKYFIYLRKFNESLNK